MLSKWQMITRVSGSSRQYSSISGHWMSQALPVEAYMRNPSPSSQRRLLITSPTPPDWEKMEMWPGRGLVKGKVAIGIHLRVGIDDPLAIGPKNANAGIPGNPHQFFFQSGPLGPNLLETGGIDDGDPHPFSGAVRQHSGDQDVFDDNVSQIHLAGHRQKWWGKRADPGFGRPWDAPGRWDPVNCIF